MFCLDIASRSHIKRKSQNIDFFFLRIFSVSFSLQQFGGDVAGAFERAGFRVSNQRRRRRSVGQGRNRREVDDVNYSLIGVNRMFGEFNFIKKVDLSSLSCGDERPTIKAPFDGDVYDIQVEEDNLILCGSEPGMSPCPGAQDVVDGLNGDTYFKRRTQMRAKKMPNGVWRTIRSTAFPEMDADSSLPEEYRGGRFVELSNGEDGESYQYWPKTEPMLADDGAVLVPALREVAVTSSCQTGIPTDDNSATINANSADVAKATFTIDFIGFDVLNNHYVKHFKLHEGGYNASKPDGIDYFESFDLNRMYAIGVFGNGAYNTYESIKTNEEVDKDFLQGDGYPDLDAATFAQHTDIRGRVHCKQWVRTIRAVHRRGRVCEHHRGEFEWRRPIDHDANRCCPSRARRARQNTKP